VVEIATHLLNILAHKYIFVYIFYCIDYNLKIEILVYKIDCLLQHLFDVMVPT
jgi:hypothetical protein